MPSLTQNLKEYSETCLKPHCCLNIPGPASVSALRLCASLHLESHPLLPPPGCSHTPPSMTGPSSASSPKKAFHTYYSLSVHPVHFFPGTVKVYKKMLQNNTFVQKSLLFSPAWRLAHRTCSMNTR